MKEDKMENIHLIFKFLWYSVLFCIWGVSCTSSGTYKKTQMDIYMQYYDFLNMLNCFCFNTVVFSLINIPTPEAKAGMVCRHIRR